MRFYVYAAAALALYSSDAAAWGVPKEYLYPLEHRHPDCPEQSHLLGFGNGSSPEEARTAARSYILQSLSSTIESEIQRVSVVHQKNKREQAETSLKNTTTVRVQFDYGQFIKDLGRTYKKRHPLTSMHESRLGKLTLGLKMCGNRLSD